jgi:hypothetical protein
MKAGVASESRRSTAEGVSNGGGEVVLVCGGPGVPMQGNVGATAANSVRGECAAKLEAVRHGWCGLKCLVLAGTHARRKALQPIRSTKQRVLVRVICAATPAIPIAEDMVLVRGVRLGDRAWLVRVNSIARLWGNNIITYKVPFSPCDHPVKPSS